MTGVLKVTARGMARPSAHDQLKHPRKFKKIRGLGTCQMGDQSRIIVSSGSLRHGYEGIGSQRLVRVGRI